MQIANKRHSIYVQLLRLLLLAAAVAFVCFQSLRFAGEYLLEYYLENSTYVEKQNNIYLARLQQFITNHELSSEDISTINKWIQRQRLIYVRIYDGDYLIYDSDYPNADISSVEVTAGNYSWESYYDLKLSDKTMEVMISGTFSYQLYNWLLLADIIFSFVLFLALVLLGIRRKMNYISKLCEEIAILEGGSLDYKITITGDDELAMLASGIDSMRIGIKALMEKEATLMQENQKIVTEMSHDIRTPITAIMLYSEILKKQQYKTEEKWQDCVDKINKKAYRLKQLADNFFEYSLISSKDDLVLEDPQRLEVIFFDIFSETCSYLEQKGFRVNVEMEWKPCELRVSTDYIMRIMDNITSNIIKYADPVEPVLIKNIDAEDKTGFIFENKIASADEKVESYGIGIKNIENMMDKMKGSCKAVSLEEHFQIVLLFPYKTGE